MTRTETDETKIAVMANDISYIKKGQDRIEQSIKDLSNTYLAKQTFDDFIHSDFANIKKIVYGFVGLVLTAVVMGVLTLIIKK